MKKEIIITFVLSTAILIPSTVWGFCKAKNSFDDWKTKVAADAIDQKMLQLKIQVSKDGKTVLASAITKTECQQALYLASLNDAEYKNRIAGFESKMNILRETLSKEDL